MPVFTSSGRSLLLMAVMFGVFGCRKNETKTPPPKETPPPVDVKGNFVDVFPQSGIDVGAVKWSTIRIGPQIPAAIADCDADGLPDAFVFNWGTEGRIWRNEGNFHFTAVESGVPATSPSPALIKAPISAAFADLDNDGLPDLLVSFHVDGQAGNDPPVEDIRVFHNEGQCKFKDVSAQWGFGQRSSPDTSMIDGFDFIDMNLDGRLDVMVRRVLDAGAKVWLYLSQPDGTWVESAHDIFGVANGSAWSNFFTDVNGDGLADVFMVFDGRNGPAARYFRRVEPAYPPKFEEEIFDPKLFGPDAVPASLMGGATGDIDGDGFLDLYLTDVGPQHLYTHASGLKDVAAATGTDVPFLPDGHSESVTYSASFADFDNDTWPDLAFCRGTDDGFFTPAWAGLLHNRGNGTFEDVSSILQQHEPYDSQWMTASDLDRDGRVDYWFAGEAVLPQIFHNQVESGKSFAVKLHGHTSNAEGVGSKITAKVGSRTLVQEMYAGSGPWGYGEHRLMFGLGTAAQAETLEVRWPSGFVQTVGPVLAGTELVVEEPSILQVTSTLAEIDEPVTILVKPAKPDGTLLGTGHTVVVHALPGDNALTVTDEGDGRYSASTTFSTAGVVAFSVSIDGTQLHAYPQVLIH